MVPRVRLLRLEIGQMLEIQRQGGAPHRMCMATCTYIHLCNFLATPFCTLPIHPSPLKRHAKERLKMSSIECDAREEEEEEECDGDTSTVTPITT